MTVIIYCKDHHRRPVRFGRGAIFSDTQAQIPLAWCCRCGSEVFDRRADHCSRCRSGKGELQDE